MISLGSSAQLGIGIAIELQNQFSGPAQQVSRSLVALKNQANANVMGAIRDYRNYAGGIAAAAGVATAGMYRMAEAGAEFQHKINQIAIVGGRDLGRSRAQLTAFAIQLDQTFARKPEEIASAMFENVKAGITTGLEQITKYQIAVATATDEVLGGENGVAFGLNSIMAAMNMTYKDFPRIANAVTAAANASQASVIGLNESMQYFANTAHLSNMNLEETLAILAKLSQAGIRGSAAGTAAANMVNYLEKNVGPLRSKKANSAWGMLGLDPDELAPYINAGKITDVLSVISSRASQLSTVNRKTALNALFNIRGERALENMFSDADPTKTFASLKSQIQEGTRTDISMKQARAMQNDLQGEMSLFKNQLANFRLAFTEAVGPTLRVVIALGTKALTFITSVLKTPIGKVLSGIAAVGIPLIGTLFAFRAATMAAVFALNTLTGGAQAQGFGSLLQAGLGVLGQNSLAAKGIAFNKNGMPMVARGQTINFGGKIYKGGQFLPKAFSGQPGSNLGGSIGNFLGQSNMMSMLGMGSKVGGFIGKALPLLGDIVSFGMRWLPVVGWIWTIYELLDSIFDFWKKKEPDPVHEEYSRQMNNLVIGRYFPDRNKNMSYNTWESVNGGKDKILQTINLNVDGKQIFSRQLQHDMQQKDANASFNINTIH